MGQQLVAVADTQHRHLRVHAGLEPLSQPFAPVGMIAHHCVRAGDDHSCDVGRSRQDRAAAHIEKTMRDGPPQAGGDPVAEVGVRARRLADFGMGAAGDGDQDGFLHGARRM
ncbi:hypothetical protein [Thauera sp.]|uniref:hypothetical protein n=1 Tax=Thauera sp. TaxID=1905334 RepID=UPI0039E24E5E